MDGAKELATKLSEHVLKITIDDVMQETDAKPNNLDDQLRWCGTRLVEARKWHVDKVKNREVEEAGRAKSHRSW